VADALKVGDVVTVTPDKPAAGGRMIARHDGMVLLVAGAIPGELARVRIERVERSMAYAAVEEALEPHPARRTVAGDPRCGGAVYAHIEYPEQTRLKGEIIRDALKRLARMDPPDVIAVTPSPERGYRMRARVHVRNGRIGFFLENTHRICDVRESGQLLPETAPALDALADMLGRAALTGAADLDVSENRSGDMRAIHIDLAPDARLGLPEKLGPVPGVTGVSWSHPAMRAESIAFGSPFVEDDVQLCAESVPEGRTLNRVTFSPMGAPHVTRPDFLPPTPVRLRRHVRAFFQGNRFLLDQLVAAVVAACPPGPVLDLYAGVGLFGVCLAATGRHEVTAVEGHPASVADLMVNAQPYSRSIVVGHTSVERFVQETTGAGQGTLILDPPRTGMSREAMAGALRLGADRVVFVSCDVATFARDVGRFVDAGYQLDTIRGFDLFPTTAHVEVFAVLARPLASSWSPTAEARARRPLLSGGDEAVEERPELAGAPEVLGVPLHPHAERRAPALHAFDHAIRSRGRLVESRGQAFDALVMAAVDVESLAVFQFLLHQRPHNASAHHPYFVGEAKERHLDRVFQRAEHLRRDILHECAPARHVHHLHPTANRQHGDVCRDRLGDQANLVLVAGAVNLGY
jgi:23S rRNA (uracil1939-C5)-methyltransferase